MDEFAQHLRTKLTTRLQTTTNRITDIAITLDGWKSPNFFSFFGITAICLTENWDLEEYILNIEDTSEWGTTTGRLPSDYITDFIRNTLQEYHISDLLRCVVADGGSDVVRGVTRYADAQYLWCTDHILSLAIQNMLSHPSIKDLVTKCKEYARLMKQGSGIRKKLKESTVKEILLNPRGENYPAHIEQQVPTRWLSAGRMIMTVARNIRRIRSVLSASQHPEQYDHFRFPVVDDLDESDMMTLLQLESVFSLINECVTDLESRRNGTAADLFPKVMHLQYLFKTSIRKSERASQNQVRMNWTERRFGHLEDDALLLLGIPNQNLYWKPERRFLAMNLRVRNSVSAFMDGIVRRFDRTDQDKRIFIATLLNPTQIQFACFHNLYGDVARTQSLEDTKQNLREEFVAWKRQNQMLSLESPRGFQQQARLSNGSYEHETSSDEDNGMLMGQVDDDCTELRAYFSLNPLSTVQFPGVLDWWKSQADAFPKLSAFARQYLVIPSTSASIERTWSSGRDIVGHRRFSLTPKTICGLLFIKGNKSLSMDMDIAVAKEPHSDNDD
mmetsp:Transcript_2450/g.9228  ORF Transcript_2450/g.9228 Transcript_2450/m.9228 type:complete len:558 (-) Transcript_2450:21-1694(-)